jgi:multisubunit Na+/H+ antiporter MnhF subunit
MKSLFQTLTLTSIVCAVSGSAMALVAAPGPEIGDGVVGVAIATVALVALVLYPRFKKSRQS